MYLTFNPLTKLLYCMLLVDITCKKKSTNIIQFPSNNNNKEKEKRSVIFVCSPRSNKTILTLVIGFFLYGIDGGQESFVLEVCEFHTLIKQNLVMYTCDGLLASTSSMQNHP